MKDASTATPTEALVLVVDDEEQLRSVLARYLTLMGYKVDTAACGEEALDLLRCNPYDVAVLDIRMPGLDGVEVMHQALQMNADLAIIFLTGHASLESAIAAVKADAVDYLLKPISVRDLAAAVARSLERRARAGRSRTQRAASERFLEIGVVTLDRLRRKATVTGLGTLGDISAELTATETALLIHFMDHPGIGLSCAELAQVALGYHMGDREASAILRPHISRLRGKIEPDPSHPRLIVTSPPWCYLFNPRPTPSDS
jgi:DNA-binding response OmpR family regulator